MQASAASLATRAGVNWHLRQRLAGRPRIDFGTEAAIREELKRGSIGLRKIAARFKVGTGTVQRIKDGIFAPGGGRACDPSSALPLITRGETASEAAKRDGA
jgi:hypothetical protein